MPPQTTTANDDDRFENAGDGYAKRRESLGSGRPAAKVDGGRGVRRVHGAPGAGAPGVLETVPPPILADWIRRARGHISGLSRSVLVQLWSLNGTCENLATRSGSCHVRRGLRRYPRD